jgi:hypothetical protein
MINYKVEHYINKIINGEVFSFTRFGDGEWLCMNGATGHNCDNHMYTPSLRAGLLSAVQSNHNYYKAKWNPGIKQFDDNSIMINNLVSQNGPHVNWVDANIWIDLVLQGRVSEIIEPLNSVNTIIVSDTIKRGIPINYVDFIEIPSVNCFEAKDKIKQSIISMVNQYDKPLFAFSASMATNVIVDELFPIIGDKCWMIDFGSIWDPYVGNIIRTYHKEYIDKKVKNG